MGPQSRPAEFNLANVGGAGYRIRMDRPRFQPASTGALSAGRAQRPVFRQSEAPVEGSLPFGVSVIDSGGIGLLGDRGTPAVPALRLGPFVFSVRSTGQDCLQCCPTAGG